jgi:hypothetical protein
MQTERPKFTKVTLYNDPSNMFSFWYPPEWRVEEMDTPHRTLMLLPDPQDPATHFMIEVKDLHAPLAYDEREVILQGVKDSIGQLEESDIEKWQELGGNGRWGLEWILTFKINDQHRKRRARLLFNDRFQYAIFFQGSSQERYEYWQGMFEFVLLTFQAGDFNLAGWFREHRREAIKRN